MEDDFLLHKGNLLLVVIDWNGNAMEPRWTLSLYRSKQRETKRMLLLLLLFLLLLLPFLPFFSSQTAIPLSRN
jgi:hypothetical protein